MIANAQIVCVCVCVFWSTVQYLVVQRNYNVLTVETVSYNLEAHNLTPSRKQIARRCFLCICVLFHMCATYCNYFCSRFASIVHCIFAPDLSLIKSSHKLSISLSQSISSSHLFQWPLIKAETFIRATHFHSIQPHLARPRKGPANDWYVHFTLHTIKKTHTFTRFTWFFVRVRTI